MSFVFMTINDILTYVGCLNFTGKTSCEITEFHIPFCKLSVHKRYMYKESTLTSIFKVQHQSGVMFYVFD